MFSLAHDLFHHQSVFSNWWDKKISSLKICRPSYSYIEVWRKCHFKITISFSIHAQRNRCTPQHWSPQWKGLMYSSQYWWLIPTLKRIDALHNTNPIISIYKRLCMLLLSYCGGIIANNNFYLHKMTCNHKNKKILAHENGRRRFPLL